MQRILSTVVVLAAMAGAPSLGADDIARPAHEMALQMSGKWQNPVLVGEAAAAGRLKAHPVLKVDLSVAAEEQDVWFMAKLAIQTDSLARTESPQWLLERAPGKTGLDRVTLTWDTTEVVAKMAAYPRWFKIELVTQGGRARTVFIDNLRYEDAGGAGAAKPVVEKLKAPAPPAPTLATPYPDNEKDFPGKGPARKMDFMQGERDAFFKRREMDKGAIVFVGDSLTGGWKNLAKISRNTRSPTAAWGATPAAMSSFDSRRMCWCWSPGRS